MIRLISLLLVVCGPVQADFIPTDDYAKQTLGDWRLLISPAYQDHPADEIKIINVLRESLEQIEDTVPQHALDIMKESLIWVEYDPEDVRGAQFFPSGKWLWHNNMNPHKERGVVVTQQLLNTYQRSPWTILHEFAHSYHYRVVGRQNPEVIDAYERAVASGLYDDVAWAGGGRREAYALSNHREFFAEMSEAYFGLNDFEPVDAAALKALDPETYQLMERLWYVDRE